MGQIQSKLPIELITVDTEVDMRNTKQIGITCTIEDGRPTIV
jgi:hypothetical protein